MKGRTKNGALSLRGAERRSKIVAIPDTPQQRPDCFAALAMTEPGEMDLLINSLAKFNAEPVGNTPDEMAAHMKEGMARWRAVIKAGNLGVD